jgi:hypothetical protein
LQPASAGGSPITFGTVSDGLHAQHTDTHLVNSSDNLVWRLCNTDSAAMTSVELPWGVLIHILQHVPLQQRLSSCAVVCKAWAAAAVAATSSISFSTPKSWEKDSSKARFIKWLQHCPTT